MSWNTKTVKYLEEEYGFLTEVVESYSGFSGKKKDFGGYLDAISLNPDRKPSVLGTQITSRGNISHRYRKITDDLVKNAKTGEMESNKIKPKAVKWLKCGCAIWIIGWESDKLSDRKGKIREIYLEGDELKYLDREVVWEKVKIKKLSF